MEAQQLQEQSGQGTPTAAGAAPLEGLARWLGPPTGQEPGMRQYGGFEEGGLRFVLGACLACFLALPEGSA